MPKDPRHEFGSEKFALDDNTKQFLIFSGQQELEDTPSNVISSGAEQDICFSRNFIKMEKCKNNSTTNRNRNSQPVKYSFSKDPSAPGVKNFNNNNLMKTGANGGIQKNQ